MSESFASPGYFRGSTYSRIDGFTAMLALLLGAGVPADLVAYVFGAANGSPMITAAWLALYGWALVRLCLDDGIGWLFWLLRFRLLLLLIMAGVLLSFTWSIDPDLTLRREIHFVGTTMLAFYLGYRVPFLKLVSILAGVLGIALAISLPVTLLFPDLGIQVYEGERVWKGLFGDKNNLGFSAAIAVLLFVAMLVSARSWRERSLWLPGMGIALIMLFGSHSATSLIALVMAMVFMAAFAFIAKRGMGLAGGFLLIFLIAAVAGLLVQSVDWSSLFSAFGRSTDLTGRREIWDGVEALIRAHPWTGTGYGTIWFPTAESEWQQDLLNISWRAYHAHNSFYQVASQVGLLITGLAILFLVQLLVEVLSIYFRGQHIAAVLFLIGFQVAYLVSDATEAFFMVDRSLFWMLEIALTVALLRQVETSVEQSAAHATGHGVYLEPPVAQLGD